MPFLVASQLVLLLRVLRAHAMSSFLFLPFTNERLHRPIDTVHTVRVFFQSAVLFDFLSLKGKKTKI